MRLVRVTLRHFRGVEESTVRFGDGVTVVVGPNEAGKSSVAEAVRLLRTTKSSSRSQAVRDVKPVGHDVGPEAELELRTGPYTLVYRKRWLKSPVTELDVRAPSREQVSGDEAHQRFARILAETVDVDLWEALEVVQGESLDQPDLARISALHRALDDSAGATGDHDALMAGVAEERERYLTANGRPRGDYAQADAEITDLEAQVERLRARSAEMDRYVEDYARNEQEHARLSDLSIDADGKLCRAEDAVRAVDTLRDDLRRSQEASTLAARSLAHAQRARDDRRSLVADLARRATTVDGLTARVDEVSAAHSAARAAEEEARRRAADAGERAREARRAAVAAALDVTRHRDAAERLALAQRVRRAREAGEERASARAGRDLLRVDDDVLARLNDRATEVQVAEGARDAAAARLEVRRLGDHRVTAAGDDVGSAPYESAVLDDVTVAVEGVVEVVVRPGTPPADLDRRVGQARDAFDVALREAGVGSLTEARTAHERRRQAESRLLAAEGTLGDVLDGTTLEDLEVRLVTLERRRADVVAVDTDARDGDAPAADLGALEDAAESPRLAADAADAEATTARDDHDGAREALAAAGERAVRVRQELESALHEHERETARLAEARAQDSDEDLDAAVVAAAETHDAAVSAAERSRAAFEAASPETLAMELANARELVESVDRELTRSDQRRVELQTLLDDRAAEGIHDRLVEAEAALDVARATYGRLHRAAQAADLLSSTLLRHRDEAQRHYVAPFKERIDRLGKVVFGPDFEVAISTDLAIETRTLGGRTVPFSSLSGGAREQLAVLGRLACAQLVDTEEGAPVILDDTLGFSDPERLERLAVVLNDVGRTAQVVLLTCQPRRFESVGGARTERLVAS
ncbi:AAA family ATPase [Mumia sp. DW29H23]|uniref:AAA family ATPase n=1 Tax=Mumia sp. DW29H23 TaxID=3421241 RepID=UPI003D69F611